MTRYGNDNKTPASAGSQIALLLAVFVTLKLTHTIGWSWWMVISPLWVALALEVATYLAVGAALGIGRIVEWVQDLWADHRRARASS
jgi:hypothetical protein